MAADRQHDDDSRHSMRKELPWLCRTRSSSPHSEDMISGIGVNYASGGLKNKAVTGEVSTVEVGGGDIWLPDHRVTSSSQIEKALEISVEADYGISAFAGVSAGSTLRKVRRQSSSLVMMVSATVKRPSGRSTSRIDRSLPSPTRPTRRCSSSAMATCSCAASIAASCSSSASGSTTGSEQTSTDIAAELSGSYGLFSAEAEVKFREVSSASAAA